MATDSGLAFRPQGRVIVFQPRPGLGDLIWHLPHIRAIAAASQHGRVTLVTKPSTQAGVLLRGDPAIERIVWFDHNPRFGHGRHDGAAGFIRLVAALRSCRADTCVLLHHRPSLAGALWFAGIPHRYGYGYGRQRRWLNHPPFLGPDVEHAEAFVQATAYTDALGLAALPEPSIDAGAFSQVSLEIQMQDVPAPVAVLGIGCHGAERQWGAAGFAELARALRKRGTPAVVLLAAVHETSIVRQIVERLPGLAGVHAAVGWTLDEVMALLSTASLFIGNDSGMMNLRAALGQPAYALFGASGPLRHSQWIRPIVPPGGPRSGMAGITPAQVLDAIEQE